MAHISSQSHAFQPKSIQAFKLLPFPLICPPLDEPLEDEESEADAEAEGKDGEDGHDVVEAQDLGGVGVGLGQGGNPLLTDHVKSAAASVIMGY